MNRKEERKEIKRLAKESLEDKWYLIQRGELGVENRDGHCAFCYDAQKKRKFNKPKRGAEYCSICYIHQLSPNFCSELENTSEVIKFLERLKKKGRL